MSLFCFTPRVRQSLALCFSTAALLLSCRLVYSQSNASVLPENANGRVTNVHNSSSAEERLYYGVERQYEPKRDGQTSAEIWSALFFGSKQRSVSKPRFAFSFNRPGLFNAQPSPNVQLNSSGNEPQNTLAQPYASSHQQLLQSEHQSEIADDGRDDTPEAIDPSEITRLRIAELEAYLESRQQHYNANAEFELFSPQAQNQRELIEENGNNSIQAQKIARLNRSKIRQTSGAVPSSRAGNAADIKMPVRPEGLRISDHSFISTDVVRLPSPGGLAKPLSQSERQNLQQQNEKSAVSQSPKPAPQGNKENTPTFDKPKFLSPANAAQVAKVRPLPNKQSVSSSPQTTLRPNAKFIDPKDI